MTEPKPPGDLGQRGRKLWRATVADFTLRADELSVLHELCRCTDTLDRIDAELRTAPLIVAGAQNQVRANPLLAEARGARQVLATLSRLLGLADVPDTDEAGASVPTPRQVRARRAAEARWSRGR